MPVLALAFACQLLVGIDDRKIANDGGMSGEGGSDPCREIGIPPAPDSKTSQPTDAIDKYFALYTVNTGTDAGAIVRPWGFNLDKTCTCPSSDSCAVTGPPFCDRDGGVDDEGQLVFTELQKLVGAFSPDAAAFFSDTLFNTALRDGSSGLLVRMRGYNGLADDAVVSVAIYSSPGFALEAGVPQWAGTDRWRVDQSYVDNGNLNTPVYEVTGWVRDFTLVASPAQIPIVIGSSSGQPVRLRLDTGHIVAKITMVNGQPVALNGTLAGRWKAVDFLQGLQGVPDPLNTAQYLCGTSSITYGFVKAAVCRHRDLTSNKDYDNQNFACDAVSFGIGFEARLATPGNVELGKGQVYGCEGGWQASCQ